MVTKRRETGETRSFTDWEVAMKNLMQIVGAALIAVALSWLFFVIVLSLEVPR